MKINKQQTSFLVTLKQPGIFVHYLAELDDFTHSIILLGMRNYKTTMDHCVFQNSVVVTSLVLGDTPGVLLQRDAYVLKPSLFKGLELASFVIAMTIPITWLGGAKLPSTWRRHSTANLLVTRFQRMSNVWLTGKLKDRGTRTCLDLFGGLNFL